MPRWKIILRAWPPAGALFVIMSFLVTAFWLWHAISGEPERDLDWLEPLAGFLAGAGAFILAAILIFRKVGSAEAEATTYGLARGLATGYYFNFARPLIAAISDREHSIHAEVARKNGHELVGFAVALPQSMPDFDPAQHATLLRDLDSKSGGPFDIEELKVEIEGRPRPVFTKVALSRTTKAAILVDIPTTLTVITDFAQFFAQQELGDSAGADDAVVAAREQIVSSSQTAQFQEVLTEFIDVVSKVGAREPNSISPAAILHVVPMKRLRRRLDELADH